jgi:DNA-binding GntR family transcriptional regulator
MIREANVNSRSAGSDPRAAELAASDAPATAVYERLRALIVRGQLAPGARLVERDIAERFSTSRTPVRSALQRLQQERYVTVPDRGKHARLVVAPLTTDDVVELFEVVGALEAAAARRAALLPPGPRARVSAQLIELNAALQRATTEPRPDHNQVFELDDAFHRTYVEAGAGDRILALHDTIKPQAERYCRLYVSALVDRIGDSVAEHEVIIAGIRGGDADGTERAVLVNWRNAAHRFSSLIATMGELGIW